MKLKTGTSYTLNQRRSNLLLPVFLFLFVCIFFIPSESFGQPATFQFNNTKLSEALLKVSKKLNVTIAFDSREMEKHKVSGTFQFKSAEDGLSNLLRNTGFKAEKKFGNYLIVPGPSPQIAEAPLFCRISGLVTDQISGEQLPHAIVFFPQQNSYLATSVNGTFAIRIRVVKLLRINIQYLGYHAIDSTLAISDTMRIQ